MFSIIYRFIRYFYYKISKKIIFFKKKKDFLNLCRICNDNEMILILFINIIVLFLLNTLIFI